MSTKPDRTWTQKKSTLTELIGLTLVKSFQIAGFVSCKCQTVSQINLHFH